VNLMNMPRLGFAFSSATPAERLPSIARAVEAAGLDDLWVWEEGFKSSAIASAAIALGATERVNVGIGVTPAPVRNVSLLAMELATLARAYPGRLIAGLGSGARSWPEQAGERIASPLSLMREYTEALHALLDGQPVSTTGRYVDLDSVQLTWPPAETVPLILGGGGPKALALSGELGDGTILSLALPSDAVADAARIARDARKAAGRDGDHPVVATLIVATGDDGPARAGRAATSWRPATDHTSWAAGDARSIARGIAHLVEAGATSVELVPTPDEPDVEQLIHVFGSEIRALID
jgi:5,10-methylenetetrahydromethanopterin reductase